MDEKINLANQRRGKSRLTILLWEFWPQISFMSFVANFIRQVFFYRRIISFFVLFSLSIFLLYSFLSRAIYFCTHFFLFAKQFFSVLYQFFTWFFLVYSFEKKKMNILRKEKKSGKKWREFVFAKNKKMDSKKLNLNKITKSRKKYFFHTHGNKYVKLDISFFFNSHPKFKKIAMQKKLWVRKKNHSYPISYTYSRVCDKRFYFWLFMVLFKFNFFESSFLIFSKNIFFSFFIRLFFSFLCFIFKKYNDLLLTKIFNFFSLSLFLSQNKKLIVGFLQ